MTSSIKSADDLIVANEREKLGLVQSVKSETPSVAEETPPAGSQTKPIEESTPDTPSTSEDTGQETQEDTAQDTTSKSESSASESTPSDSNVDEYGNTVAAERTYTQDEVNRMIRERLARTRHPQQQPANDPAVTPAATTEDNEETWQQQLASEINKVVDQREQERQQAVLRAKTEAEQSVFEEKFTQGMTKYTDFESVVTDKPITASMMLATKAMQDPAAFIYAACKTQPAELDRIAKIADPHVQIAEMARLEERMKKPKAVTTAPKPGRKITGDTTNEMPKHSIDQLIAIHAKDKIMSTRRLK